MSGPKQPPLPERALHAVAIVLFAGMCGLVLAQVLMRKFFEPLVWSEELARYTFIWVSFLGWAIASRRRSHVSVGLLAQRAARPVRIALGCLTDLATLVLAAILLWHGLQLMQNNRDVETVTLFFNYALVYAVVPFSACVIALAALTSLRERFRDEIVATEKLL